MKYLFLSLSACGLLASCDADVHTTPAENKTTIVNPPAEKKVEHTTVVTPPAEKK